MGVACVSRVRGPASRACWCGIAWDVPVLVASVGPVLRISGGLDLGSVSLAGVAGGGLEDEPGGGFGGLEVQVEQDAGVGVGGQHDAGVPELLLHGLQVGAGGVGQGRRAVAQVVQPHRRQSGQLDEAAEPAGDPVRVQRRRRRVW